MTTLEGKTLFISGGSRGIGLAIAKRAARDGANVVIAAKTGEPHPKLPGTVYTAAEEIEEAGGKALPVVCDIRNESEVEEAVAQAVDEFGGIDICVNNASAISQSKVADTDMKRYDLMHAVNGRASFMVSKYCLPHLLERQDPHILMLSPPLDFSPEWFGPHLAYSTAKFTMSLVALGLAEEFRDRVAVNALWPRTTIATSAIRYIVGGEETMRRSRTPEILADAAYLVLTREKSFTGNFLIDDTFLAENGVTDFDRYRVDPSRPLQPDFFVPKDSKPPFESVS